MNNLVTFILSIVTVIGVIALIWGAVQLALALKSQDASQRTSAILFLAGGAIMVGVQVVLRTIGVAILSYTTLQSLLSLQAASYIAIGCGLPCFLFAFARPQKMRLEQYLLILLKSELLSHRKRHFEVENALYDAIFTDNPKAARKAKGGKTHGTMETEGK